MEIGRKIYYEKQTGHILVDTGECWGDYAVESTQEQDFENYQELSKRVPETVGVLRLEYRQFAEDFAAMNGYRVNVSGDEPKLLFSYPDPQNPEQPPFFQPPLSAQVAELEAESVQTMLAVAEVYESATAADADREEEGVNTMLGLAESYDVIMRQQALIEDLTARVAALEGGGK